MRQMQRQAATGGQEQGSTRNATVRVYHEDGTIEERMITVGVTSRISAEVLSGLSEGDEVVAGIVDTASDNQNDNRRGMRFGPF
jgi:macrolide-specific efflux system membrane fusion protein